MKYIVAIIQPGKLTAVHEAMLEIGISGMTVTEVQGYGRQKGKSEIYRGAEYTVDFLPKVKIELAVSAEMASKAVEAIKEASTTGKIGDGKIFTFDLQDAVRIRTSEKVRTLSDALWTPNGRKVLVLTGLMLLRSLADVWTIRALLWMAQVQVREIKDQESWRGTGELG